MLLSDKDLFVLITWDGHFIPSTEPQFAAVVFLSIECFRRTEDDSTARSRISPFLVRNAEFRGVLGAQRSECSACLKDLSPGRAAPWTFAAGEFPISAFPTHCPDCLVITSNMLGDGAVTLLSPVRV